MNLNQKNLGIFLYKLGCALDDFGNYDRAIYFLEVGLKIELSVNGEDNTGCLICVYWVLLIKTRASTI